LSAVAVDAVEGIDGAAAGGSFGIYLLALIRAGLAEEDKGEDAARESVQGN
jgi:hypothetical protein